MALPMTVRQRRSERERGERERGVGAGKERGCKAKMRSSGEIKALELS